MAYFQQLLGTNTSRPEFSSPILSHGPVVTDQQQAQLLKTMAPEEIKEALFSIGDNKASRLDGYGAKFLNKPRVSFIMILRQPSWNFSTWKTLEIME